MLAGWADSLYHHALPLACLVLGMPMLNRPIGSGTYGRILVLIIRAQYSIYSAMIRARDARDLPSCATIFASTAAGALLARSTLMATALPERPKYDIFRRDRPGWIPEWVGDDWDPNPYAYQTDEELMPAGKYHSLYLQILGELLRPLLPRLGLRLLIDVFLFYRDWEGRKQRVAPDALIGAAIDPALEVNIRSYDLDEEPLPICAIEIISPGSRESDRIDKRLFYAALGIQEYLLLDIEDEQERLRPQIEVSLWRLENGMPVAAAPDAE